jgi:8-oxo-dGTP pyrophosphatase MutT (NUDIX family)
VQTHREFPYAATVWVRLRRGRRPLIVGARSVHVGIKPNDDPAKEVTDRSTDGRLLEWLVFDALKCDPGTAHVRDLVSFPGGGLLDHERTEAAAPGSQAGGRRELDIADLVASIQDAADDDDLREVWGEANRAALLQVEVPTPGGSYTVGELIQARHEEFVEASMKAHPAGRRKAPAAPPAPTTPAAVVEAARAAAAAARPDSGKDAAPANPLLEASPTPDDPRERRLNAARRGVLASLETLGVTGEQIGARFGRPVEQVATKRLTALVREVIATQRAGHAGQQEIVA